MGHFKRKEFECSCGCGGNTVDYELMGVLTLIRDRFLRPVTISSGYRCKEYNRKIGSTDTSQHTLGRAADIKVKGVSPETLVETLNNWYPDRYGIGLYEGFVHVDTRGNGPARW